MSLFSSKIKKFTYCPICNKEITSGYHLLDGIICYDCSSKLKFFIWDNLTVSEFTSLINHSATCYLCNNLLSKKFKKVDDNLYCPTCAKKKKSEVSIAKKEKKLQEKKIQEYNIASFKEQVSNFKASSTYQVDKYYYINDNTKEICIPGNPKEEPTFLKYNELMSAKKFESIEWYEQPQSTLTIKIETTNKDHPFVFISMSAVTNIKPSLLGDDIHYKYINSILFSLEVILHNNKLDFNSQNENSSIDKKSNSSLLIADELLKLKNLLDMNVLTEEEFKSEKEKLLNLK